MGSVVLQYIILVPFGLDSMDDIKTRENVSERKCNA